ncbi:helix-turn-helix domain-containing protein [Euzebya sp.]|uniref:helix-turn-helix domain-containing protein n=1 Tax=Euzebya sp. TaxID=1971409 RepID=UPI003519755D
MTGADPLTSGVDAVDALIDGVRVGDNLVLVTEGGLDGDWLVDAFVGASDPAALVVADGTGRHAGAAAARRVLAWAEAAGAAGREVEAPRAREELVAADREVGTDARFVVDTLTALADAWGDQAALDLFLWACPRLYRRRSIALWILDGDRHDVAFLRRLTDVTQVVVRARPHDAGVQLEVEKADGRAPSVRGRTVEGRLAAGHLVDAQTGDVERRRLGDVIRRLRTDRGVGQAELARRVGISPSALSQAERGVRAVSAETLVRLWEAMGIPVDPDDPRAVGYAISRRGERTATSLAPGATGLLLGDHPRQQVWQVAVAPRAGGRAPLFAVKGVEVIAVRRGILQLDLDGRGETLHEGDALVADTAAVTAWANPADTEAEAVWIIGR